MTFVLFSEAFQRKKYFVGHLVLKIESYGTTGGLLRCISYKKIDVADVEHRVQICLMLSVGYHWMVFMDQFYLQHIYK